MPPPPFSSSFPESHKYLPPDADASRSPCPALNALANHGYIPRNGRDLSFFAVLYAVKHVYNLSYPLALLLTTVGFLTSGQISLAAYSPSPSPSSRPSQTKSSSLTSSILSLITLILAVLPFRLPTWMLSLSALCTRGHTKIAHNASLVHPDIVPSSSPDPTLLAGLLQAAHRAHIRTASPTSPTSPTSQNLPNTTTPPPNPSSSKKQPSPRTPGDGGGDEDEDEDGLTLAALGALHALRESESGTPLSRLHEQVALGECGLAWCVMRVQVQVQGSNCTSTPPRATPSASRKNIEDDGGVIPLSTIEQWFGEERLPEGWWEGGRPGRTVGLLEAGWRARMVGRFAGGVCGHR